MATANQLEDILNSDVDESKILSLVGSLESKLASPTVRDLAGINSTTAANSNHINANPIVNSLAQPHTNLSSHSQSPVLSLMTNSLNQATSGLPVNTINGGNFTGSQTHFGSINSIVTSSVTTTSAISNTVNVNATYAHHQSPSIIRTISAPGIKLETGGVNIVKKNEQSPTPNFVKQEPATIVQTIGSTNTGTVQYLNTSSNALLGNSLPTVTRPAAGAIYDLASIAADQKRLNVQAVKTESNLHSKTIPASNIITLQNAQHNDVKPYITSHANAQPNHHMVQTLIKPEPTHSSAANIIHGSLPQSGVKQEIKFITQNPSYSQQNMSQGQTQIISSQTMAGSLANAVLRTNALTLGSGATVITRTTKPMSAPQTVTVLRAPMLQTHPLQQPPRQQTIQIVNVSGSNTQRGTMPNAVALAHQKTLAPRMINTSSGVRIAPTQPPQLTLPMRPAAGQTAPGTNIVLPPNYQLPPGTMLVRNDQGQLMLVTQQQAQALKVQTRAPAPPGLSPQTQHLVSVSSVSPSLATAVRPGSVQSAALSHIRPQATFTRTHVVAPSPTVAPSATLHGGMIPGPPAGAAIPVPNQGILESVKKCKNFLSTLLKLASQSNQPPQTIRNVKELIQGLVDGLVQPEDFTAKLQVELKSSPQPYLVPFLKKSLPLLRHSLILNKMHIDGVNPPPLSTIREGNSTQAASVINHQNLASTVPSVTRVQPNLPGEISPQLRTIVNQQRQVLPPPQSSPQTAKLTSKSPAISGISSSPSVAKQSSSSAGHKDKRKYESLKEDDDINDVATMGGVNLTEESRNILATNSELMVGQLMSCKDENFLNTPTLMCRVNAIAKKHGLDEVPQDVASLISHATQERLRNLMERLAVTAEHRLEIYKADSNYEVTDEVRQQLKFLEELEKLEQKRKGEAEREVLLRVAKSRSKHEDPEQLKLKERAKAMQQAELEEMRHREANMTALAAIGPRKKARLDGSSSGSNLGSSSSSALPGSSSQKSMRQRVKRVNLRDLMFLLENEREMNKSQTLFKSFMK